MRVRRKERMRSGIVNLMRVRGRTSRVEGFALPDAVPLYELNMDDTSAKLRLMYPCIVDEGGLKEDVSTYREKNG